MTYSLKIKSNNYLIKSTKLCTDLCMNCMLIALLKFLLAGFLTGFTKYIPMLLQSNVYW